jgi:hypothetical protein
LEHERERDTWWRDHLWGAESNGSPTVHLIVAFEPGAPRDAEHALGLVGCEYYERSAAGLVTYVAVAERGRRKRVGRGLMLEARRALAQDARAAGRELAALFGEVHEPTRVQPGTDVMPPRERVAVMARYGAKRVPIPYVQPSLGDGRPRSDALMLVAFPTHEPDVRTVPGEAVRTFLAELYEASEGKLDTADRVFARMLLAVDDEVELDDLVRVEDPVFRFDRYGVAFHFAAWQRDVVPPLRSSRAIESFERDILAYAYRADPPFATRVDVAPQIRHVDVRFAPHVSYLSEGRPTTLVVADGAGTVRRAELHIGETRFASGLTVLHVILGPGPDPDASALTEYDLIKLAKFWEVGEGLPEPGLDPDDATLFTVRDTSRPDAPETTVRAIAERVLDEVAGEDGPRRVEVREAPGGVGGEDDVLERVDDGLREGGVDGHHPW